jgi:hypothetical protein
MDIAKIQQVLQFGPIEKKVEALGEIKTDGHNPASCGAPGKHRCICAGEVAGMIGLAAGTRIWIVAGVTDLRRGFTGLSGMVPPQFERHDGENR